MKSALLNQQTAGTWNIIFEGDSEKCCEICSELPYHRGKERARVFIHHFLS